jgi:DNA-binding CsgD family transcriptional regulator
MPSLKDLEPVIRAVCTERQRHTLALVGAGYTVRQAADVLDLEPSTVRQHLRSALRNVRRALEIAA